MIAGSDRPLLREVDEILNTHTGIFYAKQSRGPVRVNHKVLDSWKQLKGFCISAAWLISFMHMLTPAAGLPLHQEPPLVPLPPQSSSFPRMFPQAVKPLLTSYRCQCHLQLSTANERTLALDTVGEGHTQ